MKVLVTGGTGFIGNYVIQDLLKRDIDVICLSTNEEKAKQFEWYNKVTYVSFDYSNEITDCYHKLGRPDKMIHLAWQRLANFKDNYHTEVALEANYAFLKNMISGGLKDLTVIGTCLEYGMIEGELKEDIDTEPIVAYAIAKNKLRILLEELRTISPFHLKWIRLFYPYGEGQQEKSLLSQLKKALQSNLDVFNMSKGDQVRDFIPVQQAGEYINDIALQNEYQGIINCGSGQPTTVIDLVKDYLTSVNKEIKLNLGHYPYPDYEPMKFWGNIDKLLKIRSL